jgi:hypothetical protein
MKNVLLATATALAIGAAGSAQATTITPAVEYTSSTTLSDFRAFTLGYMFSLSAAVTVNALGYWDDGLGNNHGVGIWNSSNALVVSTDVLGTDPLVGHFRWDPIANVTLNAGTYTIGGEFLGNGNPFPAFATGLTTIPQYTWVTDEQTSGAGLQQPTFSTDGSYGQNGILAADFSVASGGSATPLPAALPLFGAGLGLFGLLARRKKRKVSAAVAAA